MSTPGAAAGEHLPASQPADGGAPWQRYICNACGLIYDEAKGDPDSGLPPGTRFADIPDDWVCPLCAVTKTDFSLVTPPDLSRQRSAAAPASASGASLRRPVGGKAKAGVVIVGAGRAGWQMAQAIRDTDADLPVTLVTACSGDVYDKPLLSVALAKRLPLDTLVRETGPQAAARLGVRLLAHTQATRICTRTNALSTTRGNQPFDELVLAHGAQVALPPSLPAELCWRINHLDAYLKFRAVLADRPQRIAIVGAGLIGCELANDLALAGHRITLLDPMPTPMARWPAPQAGTPLLAAWKDLPGQPIAFVGGVSIAGVENTEHGGQTCRVIRTACGQGFEVDQVIAATGLATPNRLAQSAGLAWNHGIAVDGHTLATSHPHIHALGDCITVDGQASRYIEPIGRQALTIAAKLAARRAGAGTDACPVPYEVKAAVVRVKTTSCPLSLS